jgi:aldose 1-epimerase
MSPEIVIIRDPVSGASAQILVSQGFNCFRLTLYSRTQPVEVLYAPDNFASGQERPSRGGIPLLFPFPGRIPGTTFTWNGKQYALEPGDAFGNAIHGFVMWRPWRIIEQSENRVAGQFHAWRDDPSLKARWPSDFRLTATYSITANRFHSEYLIENPDNVPLPCGFGTHPYFRVPLGGAKAEDLLVKLPVSERWELKDMLPTGRKLAVDNAKELQNGKRFGDLTFDDVFAGLKFDGDWCSAAIRDPQAGTSINERFDATFRECVVFTPPHRQAICIEPYTCVPGAFDLTARGIDVGLRTVPAGDSFKAVVEISVS